MYCNSKNDNCVRCKFNLKNFHSSDLARVTIDGSDRTKLNWNEISVPEILPIPCQKPDIEQLDQVFVDAKLTSVKLIETPFVYNIYVRKATEIEINLGRNIIVSLEQVIDDADQVITDADAVLEVPPSSVPELVTFENVRDAIVSVTRNIDEGKTTLEEILNKPCVSAEDIIMFNENLTVVTEALNALERRLDELLLAGEALQAASATDVSAEIATMNDGIDTAKASLVIALELAIAGVSLLKKPQYFEIIKNEEGLCLSGRKLVISGVLNQKVVYTGLVTTQSVHSACYDLPFTAYIIPYAKFEGLTYEEDVEVITGETEAGCETKTINGFAYNPGEPIEVDVCEEFNVDVYIEDIFATMLDCRTIFKNITLFFLAKPVPPC